MRKINQDELNKILKKHSLWLKGKEGGERANLRYANLKYANLYDADLYNADLYNADLEYAILINTDLGCANLKYANLRYTNLNGADLYDANLEYAKLYSANLEGTNLRYANLKGADLSRAILRKADLYNANLYQVNLKAANLYGADLRNSNLEDIKISIETICYNIACPKEGSFIGYKKANRYIIKLLILEDAKRSSATTTKCRCDKAKVLEIEDIDTGKKVKEVSSDYDSTFIYKVGEIVYVDNFDDNRWNECSTGVHFFMNKENAINY